MNAPRSTPAAQSPWAIAIFACREAPETVLTTFAAAVRACGQHRACVDLLINGNAELAQACADSIALAEIPPHIQLRVIHLAMPDKAETWNCYVHELWQASDVTFFLDGYAAVLPDALQHLADRLQRAPEALTATGVPADGHSASRLRNTMLADGWGIHGNMYALSHEAMRLVRTHPFRLPRGIYRTDPTMAAALAFRMAPAQHDWDPTPLAVVPEASWRVRPGRWWHPDDLRGQFKRWLRQAQGDLENAAIRQHLAIDKRPPRALPGTAAELVGAWAAAHPADARRLCRFSPRHRLALKRLQAPRDWGTAKQPPQVVLASST